MLKMLRITENFLSSFKKFFGWGKNFRKSTKIFKKIVDLRFLKEYLFLEHICIENLFLVQTKFLRIKSENVA